MLIPPASKGDATLDRTRGRTSTTLEWDNTTLAEALQVTIFSNYTSIKGQLSLTRSTSSYHIDLKVKTYINAKTT